MTKQKRESVDIDESVIHDMMMGDIPSYKVNQTDKDADIAPAQPPVPESKPKPETEEVAVAPSKPRRRREPKNYTEVFLSRRMPEQKRHTYINTETHRKLARMLAVIGDDITVPAFINNVLDHHLEQYRDEIDELYNDKTQERW